MPLEIRCHGQYYAREGQLKLIKDFVETVKAPSLKFFEQTNIRYTGTDDNGKLKFSESSFINVRGILKKKLLPMILVKKMAGTFVRVRGVVIDEITADDGTALELPITLMSFSQLGGLIKDRRIPLDVSAYLNIDELRTDIIEWLEDPEAFKRNAERKAHKRAEEREFMELNGLTPNTAPTANPGSKQGKKDMGGRKGIAELSETQGSNPF